MLQREIDNRAIIDAFSILSTKVQAENLSGYGNTNQVIETVIIPILNLTYGRNFSNLNADMKNYPGIDIGDEFSGIGVQITGTASSTKYNQTLDKVQKHDEAGLYREVWMLITSNQQKGTCQRIGFTITIMNLQDLARDITLLEDDKFYKLLVYSKRHFPGQFVDINNVSIFADRQSTSADPSEDISNFVNYFNYESEHQSVIRTDLIKLKNTLASISKDERWILLRVLNLGCKDYTSYKVTTSVFLSDLDYHGRHEFWMMIDSLTVKKLARYDEDEREVSVFYFSELEDTDILAMARDYLNENFGWDTVKDAILNCNFSMI